MEYIANDDHQYSLVSERLNTVSHIGSDLKACFKGEDDRVAVILAGRLNVREVVELREQLLALVEQGYLKFSFSLSQLEFIDSTGLGLFIGIRNRVLEKCGFVEIHEAQGTVRKLLELTRLLPIFEKSEMYA